MGKKLWRNGRSTRVRLIVALGLSLSLILVMAGPGAEFAFAQGGQKSSTQYPPNWNPVIFPNKGQTPQQQDKDKFDCYNWAKQNSGFDPMAPVQATAPPPPKEAPVGGVGRGAARGAVVGVTAGAIAGDAGKGAAIGAASGALIGGMRRRDQVQRESAAEEQYVNQQQAIYDQKRDGYNRAYAACLEGKGYTVK